MVCEKTVSGHAVARPYSPVLEKMISSKAFDFDAIALYQCAAAFPLQKF
jgi:hypothetical protein